MVHSGGFAMITEATRYESYEQVKPKINERQQTILNIMDKPMTADEIVSVMLAEGEIGYYDRNFVSPRLTELERMGVIEQIGTKKCNRTGRSVTVYKRVTDRIIQPTLFARG
jgi:hypothetical protein